MHKNQMYELHQREYGNMKKQHLFHETTRHVCCENGERRTRGKIIVPENLRAHILRPYHKSALAGHQGAGDEEGNSEVGQSVPGVQEKYQDLNTKAMSKIKRSQLFF